MSDEEIETLVTSVQTPEDVEKFVLRLDEEDRETAERLAKRAVGNSLGEGRIFTTNPTFLKWVVAHKSWWIKGGPQEQS